MARIKDVAQRSGVSVATVSRVLNHNPRVKSLVRERVLQAIADLNYQPSSIARSMRKQSVRVIGLVITDIQNPFFTALVRAVEDLTHENQYTVLLCNSDEDATKERLYLDVLARERTAGVILVPTGKGCADTLKGYRSPVVTVDRKVPGLPIDSVTVDNEAGAYQVTKHLLDLGHRRIGLVAAPIHVSVGLERRRGYEKALREYGLPLDESLIATGDFKEAGGFEAAKWLLARQPRPTALFATNNLMTLGTLEAIRELGLNIPSDLSVVGFDDFPWLSLLTPPLTVVSQPTYQLGREAAQLLFRRILLGADQPPQDIVLQPEMIVRQSTSRLAGTNI